MKKSLLLIILVISGFIGFAQLEVKEGSFKKVEGFVNINTDKMFDDNEKPYAVLKIKTENINDKQRRQLGFGGDAQTFFETEYKDGEIWLYISYYATFLKISHPDLSSTEFWFPYDMEPKRGYELTLVYKSSLDEEVLKRIEKLENASNENETKYGYIIITTPTDGATVYINGKKMEMKTPFASDKLEYGEYMVKVVMDQNNSFIDIVNLNEPKKVINVMFMKKNVKRSIREKGWSFRPEVGIGLIDIQGVDFGFSENRAWYHWFYSDLRCFNYKLCLNYGYYINNYVYFGGGAGLHYCNESLCVPVYIDSRFYFCDRTVSSYLSLKGGYSLNIKSNNNYMAQGVSGQYDDGNNHLIEVSSIDYSSSYSNMGPFISFGVGIEYKHSSLELAVLMQSFCTDVSYYIPQTQLIGSISNYYSVFDNDISYYKNAGLILRYGYNFYNIFNKSKK